MKNKKENEILKKERERRGLTQEEAADVIGMSRSGYINIENGKRNPSLRSAFKIADFYNINVRLLLK